MEKIQKRQIQQKPERSLRRLDHLHMINSWITTVPMMQNMDLTIRMTFNKGASSVYADVINLGINEAGLEDCLIGGITVDGSYDIDLSTVSVKLPGRIAIISV